MITTEKVLNERKSVPVIQNSDEKPCESLQQV